MQLMLMHFTISMKNSMHQNKRLIKVTIIVFVILSSILGLFLGTIQLNLKNLFTPGSMDNLIFFQVRFPRVIVGLFVGAALSLSGTILQAIMRNSLASPNIIGVNAGAGLFVTFSTIFYPELFFLKPFIAFLGAFLTTLLIYKASYVNGIRPLRMVLAGVAVSALANSLISLSYILNPDNMKSMLSFSIGSLSLMENRDILLILPSLIIGGTVCIITARKMNIMMLGDDIALNLGVRVESFRLLMIIISSLLASSAVAVVGLLGFIGLIVPHIVKLIIGNDYKDIYIYSMLFGGAFLVFSDTVSRVIVAPYELPVGIVTTMIGAIFFIFLVRRKV